MSLWSLSVSFRLGLGFHALNNEGADGSNLMQPRRIDVGDLTYDGISGEIVRRHILQNFVALRPDDVLPMSAGLHPDRGPLGIRAAAKLISGNAETKLESSNLHPAVRRAITECAVLDIGGFLAAFGQDAASDTTYIAEGEYIREQCAPIGSADPVKRESCFDVGWLVSEEPQDLTITQHSAYRDTAKLNSRYAQTMRSNIYGGVVRADLHRIGVDDHWYLAPQGTERLAIESAVQLERQSALIHAIANFLASPTGSRVAGWAPHCFLTEGAFLLTSTRTAPFISPIKVDVREGSARPVSFNQGYAEQIAALDNGQNTWAYPFSDVNTLLQSAESAITQLRQSQNNGQKSQKS